MKFGEKVRDLRKKNSLTQDELAKCLGVSKRTIIGWERDGRYPRNVEILEKILPSSTHVRPMSSLGQHFSQIKLKKRKKISPTRLSVGIEPL